MPGLRLSTISMTHVSSSSRDTCILLLIGLRLSPITTSDALSPALALAPVFRVQGLEAISISRALPGTCNCVCVCVCVCLCVCVCVCVCVHACACVCVRA
jgi:hypothetical protein